MIWVCERGERSERGESCEIKLWFRILGCSDREIGIEIAISMGMRIEIGAICTGVGIVIYE